ncbi:hypothetical protein [uncultured Sunxiuqinia sp.]|uniref:hypothetical protein n=1 Tax=uncultured Sunxiuqinia sp. TaxID=1573825 RepID=UPI0030DBA8B4|tara:strand:- start:1103 stop:1567 length:465 start_codon:yes stop_codon:yes gene_type:complete
MKKLLGIIIITIICCFGCKDEEVFDTSLLDHYYYAAPVYRDYSRQDLTVDTFQYHFDHNLLTVIGYTYDVIDNVNVPVKIDTITHSYFIEGNNIFLPPQEFSSVEISPVKSLGPYDFTGVRWEIIKLDRSELIIDSYVSEGQVAHIEMIAVSKK